ncbi:8-oxoguanine DNA glycosylase [Peptococcaceae bacterium]|nr:8-oxoguanine DNA glycosylase [Peptococcaceae bacterium]MCL0107776.1 8-oxoguanine DNA glycosylase [Peptococcaceae bacterium]
MNEYIVENTKEFSMERIVDSGQAFRWNKDDKEFTGVVKDKIVNVRQYEDKISIKIINSKDKRDYEEILNYFDMGRKYGDIIDIIKNKDNYIKSAVEYGKGIRILNQDLWETIISFIISANNNIPRIKSSIEMICERYGDFIVDLNGRKFYSFPNVEQLSKATVDDLRKCGVGFRAVYIYETARTIASGGVDLEKIRNLDTSAAREELKKLKGVGDKIADCILLFSCQKFDVFPVDTWMKKVLCKFYNLNVKKNCEIYKFAKNYFGEYCGLAQQHLFYYARNNKHLLGDKKRQVEENERY